MNRRASGSRPRFRVWIAAYQDWQPRDCRDIPPQVVPLEPAEANLMTSRQARRYVEAFNRIALTCPRKIWAIALPVVVRWDGEPSPGTALSLG